MNGIERNSTPPRPFGREPRTSYKEAADLIEQHQNFEAKKSKSVPGDMTLAEYVSYCRERSQKNYTNESVEEATRSFEQFWGLLEH